VRFIKALVILHLTNLSGRPYLASCPGLIDLNQGDRPEAQQKWQ